ncbi:MAG: ABC transporter ATP-binding protein [Gammaproteobacteria bacterium]|nr:ABC transporter ATP-binding protein [Gammaproteobacteria bacterium]
MALLEVKDLTVEFKFGDDVLRAVNRVSFAIERAQAMVLVGESGSGKSITALSLVRLLPDAARIVSGQIQFEGHDLLRLPLGQMSEIRGARIGYVFQEPQSALNPVMSIGDQIGEVLTRHQGLRGRQRVERVAELLGEVGIAEPARRCREFPHQYSGGMKQRAMLAIALAGEPDLLIADEPTTALDVTLQAQILTLIKAEQVRRGMAVLFITHDLAVAYQVADHLAVMKEGEIVEFGASRSVFSNPQHRYTQSLLAASPRLDNPAHSSQPASSAFEPLLTVQHLTVEFPIRGGLFRRVVRRFYAVDDVSLTVAEGETLAIVGESGSGKTTMGRAIVQLTDGMRGVIRLQGVDLATLDGETLRRRRRDFQIVFQDPYASMNPRMTVNEIVAEGIISQKLCREPSDLTQRVVQLLEQVGLDSHYRERYPHELSGGQRQRVCIARALAVKPKLLVCDEPTSALDVSVQAQILALLSDLQVQHGYAYLFITHNLAVVAQIAHRVAIMHRGRLVESGLVSEVLRNPRHEYTQQLLAAVPRLP